MTALLKTERWFKHPRLDHISTSVDACAILGKRKAEYRERFSFFCFIKESAVDFESIFKVEKRLKK